MIAITHNSLRATALCAMLAFASLAQAQDLPQDLMSISPAEALALNTGRLYRVSTWPNNPPLPPALLLTDLVLGEADSASATNLFYSLSQAALFWDDREAVAEQMLLDAATSGNHQVLQQQEQGEELGPQGPYVTTDFYLEPVSVVSNLFNAILHNTTNGSTYIITSTEAIDPVTNSVWLLEGSLQGGTNDATPFALGIALHTNSLFISAQACDECATTVLPLSWQLAYFGVTGVDPNADYDADGVSNLDEFLNSTDPNKIVFSLSVSNEYIATAEVPVQLSIASGVPSYIAVLLNGDSPTNASWQPFTSTSLSVSVPTNGTYVITIGLCGLATNATQSFQTVTVFRDTTPLTLAFTNLPAFSGSRPFIDPAGYTTRALNSLAWTVVDANGATNTGNGMVVAQGWSLSDPWHVTNWFQCLDLPLALGTNWISIQAVDWAGTVAVTNFAYVFDTNGDTNAPALTLGWPQDGTQVSGTDFTVHATTDDDTAAVALQYFDGDGIVQTVNGRVERGGSVWVPTVPLAVGTNHLSLLATDAAGNVSTNNFTVVQSSAGLTISPLSQDAMKYAYATVRGNFDGPDCTITVNGMTGISSEGSWEVANVPLPLGGTVTLQASAQLGGSQVQRLLTQERDPIVFTQTYAYKLDYTFSPSTNTLQGHHIDFHWARGIGGTNVETSWSVNSQGTVVSSNVSVMVWPPDNGYWPSLTAQAVTTSYSYGELTSTSSNPVNLVPEVKWMEKSTSAGSRPDLDNVSWSQSSGREVRWFTGGNAARQNQGLFDLSASLTYLSVLYTNVFQWSERYAYQEFRSFLLSEAPPVGVPPEQITLGAEGNLGSDGHRWVARSSGQEIVITPKAPGNAYTGDLPSVTRHRSYIEANGHPLDASVILSANFCVGQKVTFSQEFNPPLPEGTQPGPVMWHFTGQYVNDGTNVVPGGTFDNSSINYFVNQSLLANETSSAWWIEGQFSPPEQETATFGEGLTFPNGQYVAMVAHGKFTMYEPRISPTNVPPPTPSIYTNVPAWGYNMGLAMIWDLSIDAKTNFLARLYYVQLINVTNSWDDRQTQTISNFNTVGQFWLDGSYPYTAEGTAGARTNFVSPVDLWFNDGPHMKGPWPLSFASAYYRFYTYACFEPLSPGSIPVALGHYYWGWEGKLDFTSFPSSLTVSNVVPPSLTVQVSSLPNWTNTWHRLPD